MKFQSVFTEYQELLEKEILPTEKESIDMINECYAGYMAFIKHKDAHRETLSPSMDNVIIFRQSFGFFQMSAIEYSPQSTEKHKMIVSNAIAPGFPELVTIKDRISPPRGMISAITLIANATIYEK